MTASTGPLAGKTALVTGSSRGIGRAGGPVQAAPGRSARSRPSRRNCSNARRLRR
jgi:NAD(P)-dependent dehydrogenase (short-subunit alcohol dehydrogenase family)